ncbi:MAG: bacillithiol biosynthesis cysteine-adding enzyme BshC [Bryobacteraceae bacterium]|nr:bacillithiol biosynthesis cysteine-adding enzyme BshC [Bryobacteraceae bacterium]
METACLRHTDLPHTSRLFKDFLYSYHRVERFYTAPPSTGYPEERRAALVAALRLQNSNEAALERLSEPGAVTVVTGQQVGLFSGPAYTIYKALTAARIAQDLTSRGRPAVPVFWLATEDHDWPEVDHVYMFDGARQPLKLQVQAERSGGIPVGSIRPVAWPVDELRAAFRDLPYCEEVCDLVAETHPQGATMGEAFRALLERLLKPWGFLFLDPLHPAIRQIAAPILSRAVRIGTDLNKLLLERNRELEAAGYHAQVHVDARTSLFFVLQDGRRVPLREANASVEELANRAEILSPNALLRPVVQDFIMPTAAYVGGPAELAYFAQSQVLYERLLGHMPRVVSRTGFTLIDTRTGKLMDRYDMKLPDFFNGEASLRERIAATLVPSGLQEQFDEATSATTATLDRLHRSVSAFDPTLGASLEKSRAKILHQFHKAQSKVARGLMQRDDRAGAEATWLYNALYPQKHLQERFYSILPFLALHGPDLLDRLYEHVHMDCPDHVLLPV